MCSPEAPQVEGGITSGMIHRKPTKVCQAVALSPP